MVLMAISFGEKKERYNLLVNRILENKNLVGKGLWEIGLDLKEIRDRQLFLVEFQTFNEFLEKKVEISRTTAFRCIGIAEDFTLRDFLKWGISKLEIIRKELNEEDRKEFLKSPNVGTRQLPEEITEYKIEKGIEDLKDLERFKEQAGKKPDYSTEQAEFDLKLIRQAQQILDFRQKLKVSIDNWLLGSKSSKDSQVMQFKAMFEGFK